jgi:hypothetical protein
MKRILVVDSDRIAAEILELPVWRARFADVTGESIETLARKYHVVLHADHLDAAPLVAADARVALLCTELAAFERVEALAVGADVIFKPSAVARLDILGTARATLKAARALMRGHILTPSDLATETGGHGVGAGLRDRVLGRRLLYDLPSGTPIDFGILDEAGELP